MSSLGMTWRRRVKSADITNQDCDRILRGLFELTVTYYEDDDLRDEVKALAAKLGGDPEAVFFGGAPR
jgi:hypothetical protein